MNAKKYQKKIDKLKKKNEYLKQINDLETEESKYKKKTPYTKKIMLFILINCTLVELFSMYAMIYTNDLTALCTLITSVVGESISFAIYSYKSVKENTQGGIVYEAAMNAGTDVTPQMPIAGDYTYANMESTLLNEPAAEEDVANAFDSSSNQ